MIRCRSIEMFVALVTFIPLVGCQQMFPDLKRGSMLNGVEIPLPKVGDASVEVAARVDALGRELLAGTPLGVPEIAFQTIGSKDPELFHQDIHTLYITEGLVKQCKTDDQLAAVLANELGRMTAEFRRTVRMQTPEPIPKSALPSLDFDPGRDLYLSQIESRRKPSDNQNWPSVNATTISEELLRNSGRDPSQLREMAEQLKKTNRTKTIASQFGGHSEAPRWTP
jgi:hypothetical protein